jgi:hypothetical protein
LLCLGMAKQPRLPKCAQCKQPMRLIRAMPAIGPLPDMFIFKCLGCGFIDTVEQTEPASEPPAS